MIKRFAAAAAIFAAGFALCAVTYGGNVASLAKGILPKLNQFSLNFVNMLAGAIASLFYRPGHQNLLREP
jgi:hypothetical protein